MVTTQPKFFPTADKLRNWFQENHQQKTEQWIGYDKIATKRKSITWKESVDQALCFGWIDGIRKSIDEARYIIRFTPRRTDSHWSAVNLKRIAELIELGQAHRSGIKSFENRQRDKNQQYSYEQKLVELPEEYARQIKRTTAAWNYFCSLPPSVKKPTIWWLVSAKTEATRQRRLAILVECCREQLRIPQLRRNSNASKKKK